RRLFPHPFVFSSLFGPQTTTNSNHSRTSAAFTRKSNHSRTYAKHRGWGSYLHSNVSTKCRRADILECGGLPPLELYGRNGWHRKSGSKLPHSKAGFRRHEGRTKADPSRCSG